MLQLFTGNIDMASAIVMIALFAAVAVGFSVYRTTRKTPEDYKIREMELSMAHQRSQFQIETERSIGLKKLEQNLITSHKQVD